MAHQNSPFTLHERWALNIEIKPPTMVEHPIEVGDGDFAIMLTQKKTVLFSRFPLIGNQFVFKWGSPFSKFTSEEWGQFINAASEAAKKRGLGFKQLMKDLEKLRKWWFARG